MNPLIWFRRRASARRERKARPERKVFAAAAARLTSQDIPIDCGANVGKFTVPLARTGATVYAFELNSAAFEELRKNTADYPNVILRQAAVTTDAAPVDELVPHGGEEQRAR